MSGERKLAERRAAAVATRWVVASDGDGWAFRWNFDDEGQARAKYTERLERDNSIAALYRLDPVLVAATETEAG